MSPNIHKIPKIQMDQHQIPILPRLGNLLNDRIYAYHVQGYQTSRAQPPIELAMASINLES